MKLLLILLIFLTPFNTLKAESLQSGEFIARVTYYWPGDSGQSGRTTSTGNLASSDKTVAVDPKIIPYGSKIYIPEMEKTYVAHDTGSAIKNRTASKKVGKNNIVIDIFCESRKEAYEKIKKYPMFMKIKIENNK